MILFICGVIFCIAVIGVLAIDDDGKIPFIG